MAAKMLGADRTILVLAPCTKSKPILFNHHTDTMPSPRLHSSITKSGRGSIHNPISNVAPSTKYPRPSLLDVPEDNLLSVASYLTVHDVRALASTCHSIRTPLVTSQGATQSIWASQMKRSFPSVFQSIDDAIVEMPCQNSKTNAAFVDESRLCIPGLRDASGQINLPLLAALLPARYPTALDSMVDMRRYRLKFDLYTLGADANRGLSTEVVQFVGDIGTGNRCIRSDEPFAYYLAPLNRITKSHVAHNGGARKEKYSKIKQCLEKMRHKLKPKKSLRPFVVPTIVSDAEDRLAIDITPRLVAYYEVTIASCSQESPQAGSLSKSVPSTNHRHRCVAIGLSTDRFVTHGRLPGWDKHSFGYHSDDGCFFHGGGPALRRYGPLFGPGDTVGCGLEFCSKRIFFTINGKFLGYAYDKVRRKAMERGVYPTVGVDTECPIYVNFGELPYRFDLSGFVAAAGKSHW